MNYAESSSLGSIITKQFEQVSFTQEQSSGLLAIIAVHNTTLGPALGGCRLRDYDSIDEALHDVLRLAEGMTYKNSLCGIPFGGGKAVIIRNSKTQSDRRSLFLEFGKAVQALGGKYITAEDLGTSVSDIQVVMEATKFASGRPKEKGGADDPSPWTALGVFEGLRACLKKAFGDEIYSGRTFAVQGIGHVGNTLCELLASAGGKLIVADANPEKIERVVKNLGAKQVSLEDIYKENCDVFCPCAIGGIINENTAQTLKCKIIAGAANNQLSEDGIQEVLYRRGIVYAPDFAINSGGVMLCAEEFEPGGYNESRLRGRISGISRTLNQIFETAENKGCFTSQIALEIAKDRIRREKAKKQ